MIRKDGTITPIEVKSGKYRSHVLLDKFSTKFADRIGERVILYTKDVAERDGIIHLPIYMAMFYRRGKCNEMIGAIVGNIAGLWFELDA